MGSVCTLSIAGYPLGETKGSPPDEWISYFAPSDFRKVRRPRGKRNPLIWGTPDTRDAHVRESVCEYRAPIWIVRDRLELFGFTVSEFDAAFRTWHQGESKLHRNINSAFDLRGLSAARARRIIGSMVQRRIANPPAGAPVLDKVQAGSLKQFVEDGMQIDTRLVLRAIIEYMNLDEEVVLDLSDQIQAGYYRPSEAAKFADASTTGGSRIVVLTEGVTDSEVLQASMALLCPHLAPFFVWPDLTVRAMGGTSGIANTLKALLPLRIAAPMIALFDNDQEGHRTITQLSRDLTLPKNVRLVAYPNIDTAKAWTTDLPNGRTVVDLNGKACSIELYFGRDILGVGEERPAVQWSSGGRPGEWQGAVQGKDALKRKFMAKASESKSDIMIGDWEDMRTLVSCLLRPLDLPPVVRNDSW